jgi:ABC-type multidrug transport system fused ATPase/permease subunit
VSVQSIIPSLFARSIDENTRFGSEDAEPERVVAALEALGATDFIERQPEGIETLVGDRGVVFSGGQRQRIALGRALLRRPRVLILDEATSALDSESETLIKEALRKLDDHPTVIMVAHRLSTVIDADRVVLMRDGRVEAAGSHNELLESSSAYRDLVDSQLVGA